MEREAYVDAIKGLLSRDAEQIRKANRDLYQAACRSGFIHNAEADLVLAEAACA